MGKLVIERAGNDSEPILLRDRKGLTVSSPRLELTHQMFINFGTLVDGKFVIPLLDGTTYLYHAANLKEEYERYGGHFSGGVNALVHFSLFANAIDQTGQSGNMKFGDLGYLIMRHEFEQGDLIIASSQTDPHTHHKKRFWIV